MRPYLENKIKPIYKNIREHSYDFPSHFHNNLEIAYCFYGEQRIKVAEREYSLRSGDAIVIFPNVPHEYFQAEGIETKSISLVCNTKLFSEVFTDIVTKYPTDAFIPSSRISENAALAFNCVASSDDEAKMIGWTYIALSDLLSELNLVSHGGDRELPARVVAYIDENFKEPLTIDYIARVFGYHPSYIAHVFCDQLKISFRTYLGAVRAEYAAVQIRTTQKSLTEIAYDSGCNSLNTFCRCFKRHFSMTPSEYKRRINNKNA